MTHKDSDVLINKLLDICEASYDEHTYEARECECYVTEYAGCQVVAFRGTEANKFFTGGGWEDILRDLRAFPWYDERVGWCHAGFLKGARAVVDEHLVKDLDKTKPIILIGHSLGGALALIAAFLLHAEGFNVSLVRTFGSPRAFKESTAESYKAAKINTIQYSNLGDPIPDVPFRFWGYRHVNEVITDRKRNGYSIARNHFIPHYQEAFNGAS